MSKDGQPVTRPLEALRCRAVGATLARICRVEGGYVCSMTRNQPVTRRVLPSARVTV
jgi:hypothetical protein